MHAPKVGLVVAPGRFHAGEVEVADIGLEQAETEHRLVTDEILGLVPRRSEGDTKYTAGSVLVVGGSPGMTGAVCLAAEAAFRADAGYVAVAVPEASLPVIETLLVEAVKAPRERVDELAKRASALAVGPGLGRGDEERALVRRLLADSQLPAVVDADALFELEPARLARSPRPDSARRRARAPARRGDRPGWTHTGSKRCSARSTATAASSCSRARTRWSPRPERACWCATQARPRWRRPEPATCSPV